MDDDRRSSGQVGVRNHGAPGHRVRKSPEPVPEGSLTPKEAARVLHTLLVAERAEPQTEEVGDDGWWSCNTAAYDLMPNGRP